MGGRSSSKTQSSQSTINKTLNASVSDIENSAIITNSGDNTTITTTDYGAIKAASDLAFESLETSSKVVDTLAYSQNANTAAIERVAQSAATGGQSIVADSLVKVFQPFAYGILVLAAVWVVYLLIRSKQRV